MVFISYFTLAFGFFGFSGDFHLGISFFTTFSSHFLLLNVMRKNFYYVGKFCSFCSFVVCVNKTAPKGICNSAVPRRSAILFGD